MFLQKYQFIFDATNKRVGYYKVTQIELKKLLILILKQMKKLMKKLKTQKKKLIVIKQMKKIMIREFLKIIKHLI